jgi:hypothetical protein
MTDTAILASLVHRLTLLLDRLESCVAGIEIRHAITRRAWWELGGAWPPLR